MIHTEMLINGHLIGGVCDQSVGKQVVKAPYDGKTVGTAAEGTEQDLRVAVDAAHEAFQTWRRSPRRERQALLRRIATLVRERAGELAELLTKEVGKPILWSEGEVARLAVTFEDAADEVSRFGLEQMPVDMDLRGDGYRLTVERFPIGVILGIVPYNWPFNLAAHKLAPALATGNTIVLKPSQAASLSTLELAKLIHEAGCPPGVVNAVNVPSKHVLPVARDPRVKMLSFTGSPPVGWMLKKELAEKRVSLELGGNATAIVAEDAHLDWAIPRIVAGGYGYAGQICIAIQHVLVHRSFYDRAREMLIEGTKSCPWGDPEDRKVVCGPLINAEAADKVMDWIVEGVRLGGALLAGGIREGNIVTPALMEKVPDSARLCCQEVFGPVLTLAGYDTLDEAISRVNSSEYGIHCGIFTTDLRAAEKAFREIEVGGVIVNDYPTLRFDNMPYGGVKRSGFGREGVRYAMEEMTELKAMLVRTV
ncbi:MAG TPA: aldehyde dehydrogenase family protein [Fimbriimonadaceae bacterium]|nr:aldehyde dehydrogenase family protein [Fimbriimonadaceae bacterium]